MKLLFYGVFVVGYYLLRLLLLPPPVSEYYLAFLNVGQGDAIVINIPEYGQVMVDTGPNYQASYLVARASVFPVCRLKSVILTHHDNDHAGGLTRLAKYCHDLIVYDTLVRGEVLIFGEAKLYVLSPVTRQAGVTDNTASLVVLVKYRTTEALLTGDASTASLESAALAINDYKAAGLISGKLDVYKVSHHGSRFNTNRHLIQLLKPTFCVISVGQNTYGHPSEETLTALTSEGCTVRRTDKDGTLFFTSR